MDVDTINPQLREAAAKLPRVPNERTIVRRGIRLATKLMRTPKTEGVTISTVRLGTASVRLYTPAEVRTDAGLLWIHGGGMIVGTARMDDLLCGETAAEFGMVIASVEYRLAPEHPFPAPLDDVQAAWRWFIASGLVDATRVVIGGQSAGGGLAASLVQRIHDLGGAQPLAQWLFCPMLDDRTTLLTDRDAIEHVGWSNAENRFGWGALLAQPAGSDDVPAYAVAARRTDVAGLPPAWIGVGDIDLFHDEDMAYATRLRDAGIDVETVIVPGAPHGFEAWAPQSQLAIDYRATAREWLGRVIAG